MSRTVLFEACVDSLAGALAAQEGGADGIELCAALAVGGITPAAGTLLLARQRLSIPIHVMIRPRGGDFCYSDAEFTVMKADLEQARRLEADGVVLGVLLPDGSVDAERTGALVRLARPLRVTFHRAFDRTRDPFVALDALIELGVDRILTSGQAATAPEGLPLIAELVRRAAGRVSIMPGAGITEANIAAVVAGSGAGEVHASAAAERVSRMVHRGGGACGPAEFAWPETHADRVRALIAAMSR